MKKDKIIDILHELGIEINGNEKSNNICKLISHYRGNEGYFHILAENTEVILLKGVYKDFIRTIKGSNNIPERSLSKMSDTAALIERNVNCNFEIKFDMENEPLIIDINPVSEKKEQILNPFEIDNPLSKVEYKLSKSDFASGNTLYTRGICSFFFPNVLNPLTASILKSVLDILNPFFIHSNFKTYSPSIKLIFDKLFVNYKNIEVIFQTLKIDASFFHLNYAPHLYLKHKASKFKVPDFKYLEITNNEIEEFLNEIDIITNNLNSENVLLDKFAEYLSLIVMAGEMIYLLLIKSFIEIYNFCGDWTLTLNLIYKTRQNNIFSCDKEFLECFNLNAETLNFKNVLLPEPVDKEEVIKLFPFTARTIKKKQIFNTLQSVHNYLNFRDKLFIQVNDFLKKTTEIFKKIGMDLQEDRKIKNPEDIFMLEINEVKNILDDKFFGNIAFTKSFKHWQAQRYELQAVPYEIYEKDIEDTDRIVKNIFNKIKEDKKIDCFSLFHKNLENGNYLISEYGTLKDILKIKDISGIISSVNSFFSYVTEYACINDISLYTGIRYANYRLNDKKIKANKEFIEVIQD